MAKKKRTTTKRESTKAAISEENGKLSRKDYEAELYKLHAELVKLQYWVKEQGLRVVVVFEGRDAAGKGGVIKRITERVSHRVFREVALPTPNEREKGGGATSCPNRSRISCARSSLGAVGGLPGSGACSVVTRIPISFWFYAPG